MVIADSWNIVQFGLSPESDVMKRDGLPDASDTRFATLSIVGLVLVVVVLVLLLQCMFGVADAVLAIIGVLVTASVSLIGLLINRKFNQRLHREHQDERSRQKLDAAMRAGKLFAPAGDGPANPAAAASGLL